MIRFSGSLRCVVRVFPCCEALFPTGIGRIWSLPFSAVVVTSAPLHEVDGRPLPHISPLSGLSTHKGWVRALPRTCSLGSDLRQRNLNKAARQVTRNASVTCPDSADRGRPLTFVAK